MASGAAQLDHHDLDGAMTLLKNLGRIEPDCCIRGCDGKGVYQPVFVVYDPRTSEVDPKQPLRAYMQHKVCGEHKYQLSIGAMLTDQIWGYLRNAFKHATGGIEPRRDGVVLEFENENSMITLFGKAFANEKAGKRG